MGQFLWPCHRTHARGRDRRQCRRGQSVGGDSGRRGAQPGTAQTDPAPGERRGRPRQSSAGTPAPGRAHPGTARPTRRGARQRGGPYPGRTRDPRCRLSGHPHGTRPVVQGSAARQPAHAHERWRGNRYQPCHHRARHGTECHVSPRQTGPVHGASVGIPQRRPARGQYRGRHLPGHLRHHLHGVRHVHHGDPLRHPRRHLPARIRPAGAGAQDYPHLGLQPGRRALHRLRRVRPGLFRLFPRRQHRPDVLRGGPAGPHLRHPGPVLGLVDPGPADPAHCHRLHRGRPGAHPLHHPRGQPGAGRHQGGNPVEGGRAAGDASHDDRPDPGHRPRRRRGGAADAGGRGQARPHPARGRHLPLRAPGTQDHAPGFPHLRCRFPEPQRRGGAAAGLCHGADPGDPDRDPQPDRHQYPQPPA